MIKLDAAINDKTFLRSIQKGVDTFNRSTAGRAKLKLKIDERGFRQPLGRITGDLDKFESALAASNARVIAFGASTAVIGGVTRAFKELAATTINVQKQFTDINRILQTSNKQFEQFSNQLFKISKQTATSFDDAAKGALEFARQGLSLNEVLTRTSDALTLVRLTGVNADKAVSALTATVNAFQQSSLTTTEALNKFVAVETKFAVSARDLMEGLGRVGSSAVDAKVSFDELNAMVAAVQQQTGRGGAVIGNALKTIFTRLQRRDTLEALESYGVLVRDVEGATRPAMHILQDFAKTYKTLSDANRAYLREQVAGVFQANILSAIVKDLNSNMQVYGNAMGVSADASNEAAIANARLNQSLSALISQTGTELVRLQENIGKVTFEPIAKALLGPFQSVIGGINNLIDGEGLGSDIANGVLKGIRNVLAGPGLVGAIALIGTAFVKTVSYAAKALPTLIGITTESQKRANIENTIVAMLSKDADLSRQIAAAEGNAAKQAGILLGAAQKTATAFQAQERSVRNMVTALASAGATTNKLGALTLRGGGGRRGASGFIPGVAGEMNDIRSRVGGVSTSARPVHIPNFAFGGGQRGSMVANTGEYIVPNFSGGGSAIFNPDMVKANGGLPKGAKRITAAQGYVPNFAGISPSAFLKGGGSLGQMYAGVKSGQLSAVDVGKGYGGRTAAEVNALKNRAKRERDRVKAGPAKGLQLEASGRGGLGVGAIVGVATRKPIESSRTTLGGMKLGAASFAGSKRLKDFMMQNPGLPVTLSGIPIGGINRLKKDGNKKDLEAKFSQDLNQYMVPALGDYAGSAFGKLFKNDGKEFVNSLKNSNKRVFSTSAEGAIFESALQLASMDAGRFGGDDSARFDFEESGTMDSALRSTFFKGKSIYRADAKRSDSAENIATLIHKSFGTKFTAGKIEQALIAQGFMTAGKGRRAAGGYIPNFAGGGLGAAIARERGAGIPSSAIRINSSPRFQGPGNPAGLAVTNTIDEPRGLRDVPNFALPPSADLTSIFGAKKGMINTQTIFASLTKAANQLATALSKGTMTQGQVDRTLRQLGGKYSLNDKAITQMSAAVKTTSQQITAAGNKAAGAGGAAGGKGGGFKNLSPNAGLGLMLAAPMVAGAAEQLIGGRTGGAISGAVTGATTGGMLGAALGSVVPGVGNVVGGAVGAGVGGLVGGVAGFSSATVKASEELEKLSNSLASNKSATDAYISAQKRLTEDLSAADLDQAIVDAQDALFAIDDPKLRKAISEVGNDFTELSKIVREHNKEESKRLGILTSITKAEQVLADDVYDEEIAGKTNTKERMRLQGAKILGPMALSLIRQAEDTGQGPEGAIDMAKRIQDAITASRTGARGKSTSIDAGDLQTRLEKILPETQAQDLAKFLGSDTDVISKDLTLSSGTEMMVQAIFNDLIVEEVEKGVKLIQDKSKNITQERKALANFSNAVNQMFTDIDESVIARSKIARQGTINLARRSARVSARASLLGKSVDPLDAATEARNQGLRDIDIRRGLLEGEVVTAQEGNLGKLLEGLAGGSAERLNQLNQNVLQKFRQGDFTGALSALRTERERTTIGEDGIEAPIFSSKQIQAITKFSASLKEEIAKRENVINKDEKLIEDKFRVEEVRSKILEQERQINLDKEKYITALQSTLTQDEQASKNRLQQLGFLRQDPRNTMFMNERQSFQFERQIGLAELKENQELQRKREDFENKKQQIDLLSQSAVVTSTNELVSTNLKLIKALEEITEPQRKAKEEADLAKKRAAEKKLENELLYTSGPADAAEDARMAQLHDILYTKGAADAGEDEKKLALLDALIARTEIGIKTGKTPSYYDPVTNVERPGGFVTNKEKAKKYLQQLKTARGMMVPDKPVDVGELPPLVVQTPAAAETPSVVTSDLAKIYKEMGFDPDNAPTPEIAQAMRLMAERQSRLSDMNETGRQGDITRYNRQTKFTDQLMEDQNKFSSGVQRGFSQIFKESEKIMTNLGERLPLTFRDNMVTALEDIMDKTQDFDDAMRGVAIAFLKEMRRGFLKQGVSAAMNAFSAPFAGPSVKMQSGSMVPGSGSGDKIPALLEPGEFVLNRNAVDNIGAGNLNAMNFGMFPRFQSGGLAYDLLNPNSAAADKMFGASRAARHNVWDLGLGFTVPRTGRRTGPKKDVKRALKAGQITPRQAFQFRKGFGLLDGFWTSGHAGADISFPRTSAVGNIAKDARKAFASGIITPTEYKTLRDIHGFQKGGLAALSSSTEMSGAGHFFGSPEADERAKKVADDVQKRQQKRAQKEQTKRALMGMLISAGIGQLMSSAGKVISDKMSIDVKWGDLSRDQKNTLINKYGGDKDLMAQSLGAGSFKGLKKTGFRTGRFSSLGREIRSQRAGSGYQTGGVVDRYGIRGYQAGGTVLAPSSNSNNTNNINITVNTGGSGEASNSQTESTLGTPEQGSEAKVLAEKIRAQVMEVISEQQRVSGTLSPTRRRP